MDALRNSKKISLLAVAILFLFTFFNLILDALVLVEGRIHLLSAGEESRREEISGVQEEYRGGFKSSA
jgi:hypothetical protein